MIFEPYLGCYSSIFSPDLVCRSWDYGLSAKSSPICNRMSGTWSNYRFVLWKHITLICQHDKLPLVRWYAIHWHITYCICTNLYLFFVYFCRILFAQLSQKFLSLDILKFSQYLWPLPRNRVPATYSALITHPWRHPGAILCFHVIIWYLHIRWSEINRNSCTHKLQMISQHTDNPCSRAPQDAHVRARQNFKMLKITYKQFWVRTRSFRAFQNFPSVPVHARVVRAHSARKSQNSKFLHDLDSSYHNWQFPFICIHSRPFIRPCERVKV